MKYLKQFTIILAISFAGEVLHYFINLPVPASIYGIAILFLLLQTGLLKADSIRETAKFLIEIMPVMFIPAAVGLIDVWDIIRPSWYIYLAIILISTVLVMAAAAAVSQFIIRRRQNR